MVDKLIGADALTRAIVNSPSDISGYNPVYCNGVAKRQLEILDIVLNMNGTTEGEIRAKAIDECIRIIEETPWKDTDMLVEELEKLKGNEFFNFYSSVVNIDEKSYKQAVDDCYTKAKTMMEELVYLNQGRRNGKTHRVYCIQALEFLRQVAEQLKGGAE